MGLGTELTPSAGTEGAPDHPAISPAPILCFEAPFLRKWSPRLENTWQYGKVERERERRKGQLQNRCQGSVRTQSTARPHTQGFLSAEHSQGHSLSVRPRAGKHVRSLAPSCAGLGCKQEQPLESNLAVSVKIPQCMFDGFISLPGISSRYIHKAREGSVQVHGIAGKGEFARFVCMDTGLVESVMLMAQGPHQCPWLLGFCFFTEMEHKASIL